jgi:hypothetical protein
MFFGKSYSQQARDYSADAYNRAKDRASDWYDRMAGSDAYGRAKDYAGELLDEWRHPLSGERGPGMFSPQAVMCFALGCATMYLLDPQSGRRRRALIRDKFVRMFNWGGEAWRDTSQYARDKARGLYHEGRSMVAGEEEVSDDKLCARVRSEMGRGVGHPGSVEVTASNGTVTLRGPVLADEVKGLISCVRSVRGVKDVINQLEVHETAAGVPGLQGVPREARVS